MDSRQPISFQESPDFTGYNIAVSSGSAVRIRAPLAIERFFDASLYLLIATGFLTLASTGKLDLLSLVFIAGALIVRGILLVRGREFRLSERYTNYATLFYVLFYAADFFLLSGNFVYATVHLVLFIMAIKMFSARRQRDNLYLALLAFLMVLAAAVLTVSSTFFFAFLLFLVLTATTFLSMEMKRSAESASAHAREVPEPTVLSRAVLVAAVILVITTAVASPVVFYVLPRTGNGYLSQLAQSNDVLTGFGNEVQLGQIGEIKQSSSIVMHVQIYGDTRGSFSNLKWRGIALGLFNGHKWNNPLAPAAIALGNSGRFYLRPQSGAGFGREFDAKEPRSQSHTLNYRVVMEPLGTNVFFMAPFGESIAGNYRSVTQDRAASVFSDAPIGIYQAQSDISETDPELLRRASGGVPPEIELDYLQLPKLDARIAPLAARITAGKTNDYDRARAIEEYLGSHYGYTLKLSQAPPQDPLAEFLFTRKQGHCEYFASAMAIMLRTLRIPARVVNGFRSAQFNDLTSSYIVRASEAHTWVEVYFPGYGWSTFDPTPPDPNPASLFRSSRFSLYLDALGEFWREWVINYDFNRQNNLQTKMFLLTRGRILDWRLTVLHKYHRLLGKARKTDLRPMLRRYGAALAGLVLLLLIAANGRNVLSSWRRHRIAARPEQAPRAAASIWYERMTASLARRGCEKKPAQTPAEFVTSILNPELRRAVSRFTRHYHRARFGEMAEDAKRLPELYEEVETAARR
jgi:protein-glutamine gamma-glutamyltransferase